jgi:hypothetical protein
MAKTATERDDQQPPPTLRAPAVFGLTVLDMLITLVPVALALDRLWLAALFALAVAIGVGAEWVDDDFEKIRSLATARPAPAEFLLAGAKELQTATLLGLFTLLLFYGIRWTIGAIEFVVNISWNDGTIAAVTTAVVMFYLVVGATMVGAREMAETLYPATAGIPSGFSAFARNRRRLVRAVGILLCATVLAFLVVAFAIGTVATLAVVVFLLALFSISIPLTPEEHEAVHDRPDARTLEAAISAFGKDRSVSFPRSRHEDIDPLLLDVDLLVYPGDEDEGNALAVDIKQRPSNGAVDWTVGSALVTASRAMETVMVAGASIHPVVLLVDTTPDDTLRSFCRTESVTLVEVDTKAHDVKVTGDTGHTDLRDAPKRLLDLLAVDGTAAGAADVADPTERLR